MTPEQQRCTSLHALTDTINGGYLLLTRTFGSASEAAAAARAVQAFYEAPVPLSYAPLCAAARDWQTPDGRTRLLNGLAVWGKTKGFAPYALGPTVGFALWRVLTAPTASTSPNNPENAVAFAATSVVTQAKDAAVDNVTYQPLWQLALGGARGQLSVRVRVGAMKALQAILRRGGLLPGELTKAEGLAQTLNALVVAGAPGVPANEREWYLSEAAALLGAAAQARSAAALAPMLPTVPPVPVDSGGIAPVATWPWWTWAALAGGAVVALGSVVLLVRVRRAPATG
jgi:hypothetical protein